MSLKIAGSVLVITGLLAATTQVWAQDVGDDWDYGEDPARDLTVAAVTFDSFGVAVRCLDDTLSVVLSGLPVASGERRLDYRLGEQPEAPTQWISGQDSAAAFAIWPRAMATQLSGGGRLAIGAPDGERVRRYVVDLPPSPQAIGKVFRACGHDLRSLSERDAPTGESFAGLQWIKQPEITFPDRARYGRGLAAVLCKVRANGHLRDCTIESEFPDGSRFGRAATLGAHRSGQVGPVGDPGVGIEGREISFISRYALNEGFVTPPPSRLPGRDEAYNPAPDKD